jgi:NAD(P)-dependent dehydrogenase (short-subunit alcohol dehydrogenase family)
VADQQPRAVVITGASTGIGEACALRLDAAGFRVFAGVRRTSDAEALAAKGSARLSPILLDVADPESIHQAVDAVRGAIGSQGLAGLVNNAGISASGPLEFLPLGTLRNVLEVNVVGQLAVTQGFLPMLRDGQGRVIMVGSILGLVALPLGGAYAASKFALEGLSDVLRLELAAAGITVSIIEPGAIATPIWSKGVGLADDLLARLSTDDRQALEARYGDMLGAARTGAQRSAERGLAPDAVAQVVEDIFAARRPSARYVVGRDARVIRWLRWLPVRRFDRIRLRMYGRRP